MNEINKSDFRFIGYKILKTEINLPRNDVNVEEVNININPSGKLHENRFDLILIVNISDTNKNISIEIEAIGYFEFKNKIQKDSLPAYFTVNAPALLFPYIRAYISLISSLSGTDPIILPTLNLTSLKEALRDNIEELDDNK
jgi:preprotein translocase subunit SecB